MSKTVDAEEWSKNSGSFLSKMIFFCVHLNQTHYYVKKKATHFTGNFRGGIYGTQISSYLYGIIKQVVYQRFWLAGGLPINDIQDIPEKKKFFERGNNHKHINRGSARGPLC